MLKHKLILSTTKQSYLAHNTLRVDNSLKLKIVSRDKFTCQCCGFNLKECLKTKTIEVDSYIQFLDIHHIDDDHQNNNPENLLTACLFCHAVFHSGCLNDDSNKKFKVILYPWLSQTEINVFMNLVFVAAHSSIDKYTDLSAQIIEQLDACSLFADTAIETGASDAKNLASSLLSISYQHPTIYEHRAELMAGIRLFPVMDAFKEESTSWGHAWLPDTNWQSIGDSWIK